MLSRSSQRWCLCVFRFQSCGMILWVVAQTCLISFLCSPSSYFPGAASSCLLFFFFNKCVYILQSTAISCSPLLVFSRDYVFLSPVVNYYLFFTNIDTHVCSTAISCRSGAPPNRRDDQCPNSLPSQEGNRSPISALQTLFWFKKRVVFDGRIFVE